MMNIKKLKVEGFEPNKYAQVYEGTEDVFLPLKVQLAWFWNIYPEGRISISKPEFDPERTAGKLVATARIYANVTDDIDKPLSEASARRGINDANENVDPYAACQAAALSQALKNAGFWVEVGENDLTKLGTLPVSNVDADPFDEKTESAKANETTKVEVTNTNETTKIEVSNDESSNEASNNEDAPSKRKRRTKAEMEAARAAELANAENNANTEASQETSQTVENDPPQTNINPSPEQDIAQPETSVEETSVEETVQDDVMTKEKAEAVVCTYRNYKDMTIGEMFEAAKTNRAIDSVLAWFASQDMAMDKYPNEAKAVRFLKNL